MLSIGFISARLLAVATGDPETAYAILQATGTGSVIAGGLIPAIGLLVFPLIGVAIYHGLSKARIADSTQTVIMLALGTLALVITIFTAPAVALLASLFTTLVVISVAAAASFLAMEKGRRTIKKFRPSPYALVAVYSVTAVVFVSLSLTPWVPSENIVMKGRQSFSAYILAQNDKITSFLTQNPTAVVQVPTNQIISTQICKTPDYRSQEETINQWFGNLFASKIFPYPRCDPGFYNVKHK